ncbi:hypothetical protein YB2330_005177 [Saitoella coloradoensis]
MSAQPATNFNNNQASLDSHIRPFEKSASNNTLSSVVEDAASTTTSSSFSSKHIPLLHSAALKPDFRRGSGDSGYDEGSSSPSPLATPDLAPSGAQSPVSLDEFPFGHKLAAQDREEHHGVDQKINNAGLNGLDIGGVTGLETGSFVASAMMPIRYEIKCVDGILDPSNTDLLVGIDCSTFPVTMKPYTAGAPVGRRLVIVDNNVYALLGDKIKAYFDHHGVESHIHPLRASENTKEFDSVQELLQQFKKFDIDRRNEPIIAVGGGVTLDICSLAANLWRRNTPIVKVPTTLIGMVDAGVGVKTAVNWCGGKNKIGTYCAPLGVFVDAEQFLGSTGGRGVGNGMGEILKMACVKDLELFELMEGWVIAKPEIEGRAPTSMIMKRAIQGMLEELAPNLFEHTLYRVVDYGHTFSPFVEMDALETNKPLLHGEAVNLDMALSTMLAHNRGWLYPASASHSFSLVRRTYALMSALGLPLRHASFTANNCITALGEIEKARGGRVRVPLMSGGIGVTRFADDVCEDEVARGWEDMCDLVAEMERNGELKGQFGAEAQVTEGPLE